MSSRQAAYAHKRRSTRIDQALPLAVQGVGAVREPYQEEVTTLSISCHGCSYQTKHEVLQGELVYLEVRPSPDSSSATPARARVKWVQKAATPDRSFRVAVELENAGNIWGIPAPPEDWFAPQGPGVSDSAAVAGRELRVVPRSEQKSSQATEAVSVRASQIERSNPAAQQLSSLGQMMAGLGEQIQTMASAAAREALAVEKSRQLEEFRQQIRDEAAKTMESVMSMAKEDITRQALKGLMQAHEAGARINHARWIKKIEEDMETARQHMVNQVKEVNHRIESLATSTVDRVQRNMESTRNDAVERFVTRFREQVTPLVVEANESLQKLAASETAFKRDSETIYTGLENRLESHANESLARTQEGLTKTAAAVAAKTNETLLLLSRNIEKTAQENLQSLLASMGSYVTKVLDEKTAELSREFAAGLESYTRNYLEMLGKSIAEIPKNTTGH